MGDRGFATDHHQYFPDDFHPYSFKVEENLHPLIQYDGAVIQDQDPRVLRKRNLWINNTPTLEEVESAMGGLCLPDLENEHYSFAPRNRNIWINNTPTVKEIESAMGGLCLPNNTPSLTNEMELNIMRMRATVEATLQRVHGIYVCGYNNNNHRQRRGLVSMAKDRGGCLFLQSKIENGSRVEVERILSELKCHLHELMMHRFGNFLIQKIFQARRTFIMEQIDSIVFLIILNVRQLRDVCMDNYGTRAIQKMLENIQHPNTIYAVVYTMKNITAALMIDVNGSHVILHCLKLFPSICQKVILDEIARNCVEIATDKVGCSVIQKSLTQAEESAVIQLVTEIISNALFLAEDPYGNYVLQFLIELEVSTINEEMIKELCGTYARLSMNKHGSNVVEDLLKFSRQNVVAIIVQEIMGSDDFLDVLQDPFGNYVAQRALEYTKGCLHWELSNKIKLNRKNLHNHLYGKRVLKMAYVKEKGLVPY